MYLNSVYLGEGAYGVADAAKIYFGKDVPELNLAESAVLAALLVAPSELSPFNGNEEKLKKRFDYVLEEMVEKGHIGDSHRQTALKTSLEFETLREKYPHTASHFAFLVRDEINRQFGEERVSRSGFRVYTTIDLGWQRKAEQELSRQIRDLAGRNASNGAVVVENAKTGEIMAMTGSYDWENDTFGKFNAATALRQPGSAFKPIVYAAALERGLITNATVLQDRPITIKLENGNLYKPENFDRKFRGPVLVRRALANSLNVPAVEVMLKVGVSDSLEMAKRMGINSLQSPSNYGPSLVLGAGEVSLLELTNAYATFANSGYRNKPIFYTKIEDKYGREIYTERGKRERALDESYAFLITSILSDPIARSEVFGSSLNTSVPAAVKTGTTTDYRDSWTIGYTPSLAIGVWIGNNDNKPMDSVAGSLGAAPIWKNLTETFSEEYAAGDFESPPKIIKVFVCKSNGFAYKSSDYSTLVTTEYFIKGSEPKQICTLPPPTESATKENQKPEEQ